jgi:L-ornithine Nalpha-acyltransferase
LSQPATKTAPLMVSDDPALARLGSLDVRLARHPGQFSAAARLRQAVFSAEYGLGATLTGTETDSFDPLCDHIIVRDLAHPAANGHAPIVGTSRVLRPEATSIGFYSGAEFDLAPLFARHRTVRFCEVGRSCIAPTHRARRAVEALWRGLFVYAARHAINAYFGVASFPGTDPRAHATALSWLYHNAAAPAAYEAEAKSPGATAMNLIAPADIDHRLAMRDMPPLLRGYLRIGASVAPRAFVDTQFGTIDVLVIAPLGAAPELWRKRFETATGMGLDRGAETVPIAPDLL